MSSDHRRWAIESALIDFALRQAAATLAEVLGLDPAHGQEPRQARAPCADRLRNMVSSGPEIPRQSAGRGGIDDRG
jgi:hypothetical protein